MRIEKLTLGELQTNCYLVSDDEKKALIIDPADDASFITEKVLSLKLKPQAILLTHGHFDHLLAAGELQLNFKISVYCQKNDRFIVERTEETATYFLGYEPQIIKPSVTYFDISPEIKLPFQMKTIHTPGHTPGSVSYYFPENNAIFSGDLIFENGVGRYDFSYSNKDQLFESIKTILSLDKETVVYPGHGESFKLASQL